MMDKSTTMTIGDFYIPGSNVDPAASLAYLDEDAAVNSCSPRSNPTVHSSLPLVSTAPQLISCIPPVDSSIDDSLPPFRARCYSAPSVLYHQVALQLRSISDDFNREYCQQQQNVVPVPQRRASLPTRMEHHHQLQLPHEPSGQHRPGSWLHSVIESFRAPRSHHSSISRVPEELDEFCCTDSDPSPTSSAAIAAGVGPPSFGDVDRNLQKDKSN